MSKLRAKQRAFIDEYLLCWNAAEAARRAGYSERTAGAIGHENLKKPDIIEEIQHRVNERTVSVDEALSILTDHARGSAADFLTIDESGEVSLDLQRMNEAGKMNLIKRYRKTQRGDVVIEMYDAQAAIDKIMRIRGSYAPAKQEHSGVIGSFDLARATDEQLQRIAAGEDPVAALAQTSEAS